MRKRNEYNLKLKFRSVVHEATNLLQNESIDPIQFTDRVKALEPNNGPIFSGDHPSDFKTILEECGRKGRWDYREYHVLFCALKDFHKIKERAKELEIDYIVSVTHHSAAMTITKWLQTTEKWRELNKEVVKHHVLNYSKLSTKLEGVNIDDTTVAYFEEIWELIRIEFKLPTLEYILYSIETGSIIVSWLIPAEPWIEEQIKKSIPLREHFLKRLGIVCIMINGRTIYSQVCYS